MEEESEVCEVVREMSGDKAPGPSGSAMAFLLTCWEVVKEDLIKVFHNFYARGIFFKVLMQTFIALSCRRQEPLTSKSSTYKSCEWSIEDHF